MLIVIICVMDCPHIHLCIHIEEMRRIVHYLSSSWISKIHILSENQVHYHCAQLDEETRGMGEGYGRKEGRK
jgi:hypothetical protein